MADYRIVVIGTSLGGLMALETVLSELPADFPLPLVVVQHRSVDSSDVLLQLLRRTTPLPLREPDDKEPIRAGYVYIAPANYHLLVDSGAFSLSTDAPVSYARPSIDVLFESTADSFGEKVIAVILTGANRDGARGAAQVKAAGGFLIVEDPETAESRPMPLAALAAAEVDKVLSVTEIGLYLTYLASLCDLPEAPVPDGHLS